MKVMITGCAGFIGSNLVNRCVQLGWDVVGVDDLSNGVREFVNKECKFIIDKFDDQLNLSRLRFGDYDVVFHLAALPRVAYSVEQPLHTNSVNVSSTLELMEAATRANVRFIFASSSSVYGNASSFPTREEHALWAIQQSPYALQKYTIEKYLRLYNELYNLESASLRFFNVFGPNQLGTSPYATAISSWLTAIYSGNPIRSDGDGTQSRDLTYVDNVVDALVACAQYPGKFKSEVFNIGCGESTTNKDIIEFIRQKFPKVEIVSAPKRAGDVQKTHADITYARGLIGYDPKIKVFDGIKKTISWFELNWPLLKGTRINI